MRNRAMGIVRRVLSICLLVGLTAGAVVVARGLGSRPDPRMVRLLGEPGAIESLTRRGRASETEETGKAKPPLVVQAEAFALYLNPPQPPKRTPPPPRARVTRVEVAPVAAVSVPPFQIVGISYHRTRPEESRALVSEAGGKLHWVAPGAKLGPMIVRQINRGSVLCENVAGMHEMAVELGPTQTTPSLPALPAKRPTETPPAEGERVMAVFANEDVPQAQEEPPPTAEAGTEEPRGQEPPAPEVTEPEPPEEPAPSPPTPGRRPRPGRSIARRT